ncbi:uncharacterized protein [Haliotis cracherodii]|uniref:uncharacterized protein n=1 Tax=Haliotis cracherodii TaxID=6455 RepID=UPI0039EBC7C8
MLDYRIAQAQDTCPSIKPELWSFVRYTGKCWIIRNVQEVLNFTICGFTHCQSCNDFFSASSGTSKKCVREFQYFSVWAFCEGLPAQNQISRERIILPVSCSCKTIHCYANDWWWRR